MEQTILIKKHLSLGTEQFLWRAGMFQMQLEFRNLSQILHEIVVFNLWLYFMFFFNLVFVLNQYFFQLGLIV